MSDAIISMPLAKPPRGANELSSKGNLLVCWRLSLSMDFISDENGVEYHFAMHSPAWGWRGYRWNEKFGKPWRILPVHPDTVWIHTSDDCLMRLRIGQNGGASITAQTRCDELLDAEESGCLVRIGRRKIKYLRSIRDNGQLFRSDIYTGKRPAWAYFLLDGAIVIYDSNRLIVLSPGGNILHEEEASHCHPYQSFVIRHDHSKHIYYTDDPRQRWCSSEVLKVHCERTGAKDHIYYYLFTAQGDDCYIALGNNNHNVCLYRFSSKLPDRVEHVWRLEGDGREHCLVWHNGLICATSCSPIVGYGGIHTPVNDGFLVWDPITNSFYTDIPRATNIQKISAWRVPTISFPHSWGRNTQQR